MARCTECGGPLTTLSSTELTCTHCGRVNDGTQMVNELTFGESSSGAAMVHGTFLTADQGTTSRGLHGHSGNSRLMTIEKAQSQMMGVAHNLKIPESTVMQAMSYFKLALGNGFVKGRKSRFVTSACLYLACRQHKTSHMIMNFASLLYVNVFVLGSTYLQLVRSLKIEYVPPLDPSVFIQRFVSKLDFPTENDGRKVMRDAIRLVQRMNKDWISEGRRPAGVAAASVLLACRINNFRRSKLQIMQMAMIGEGTINDRLKEFRATDAATLTIRDFQATNVDSSANPPAFTRNRETERAEEVARAQRETRDPLDDPSIRDIYEFVMETAEKQGLARPDSEFFRDMQSLETEAGIKEGSIPFEKEDGKAIIADELRQMDASEKAKGKVKAKLAGSTENKDLEEFSKEETGEPKAAEAADKPDELSTKPNQSSTTPAPPAKLHDPIEDRQARIQAILKRHNHPIVNLTDFTQKWDPKGSGISSDPEHLSDVDDDEIDAVLLPPHLVQQREQVWLTLNKDYELDQAHKRNKKEADIMAGTYKEPRKRKRPANGATAAASQGRREGGGEEEGEPQTANAAAAGMVRKKQFSRKINYNAVSNLFD